MSTAHVSFVFLLSYRNTIFNQSAHMFSSRCFLKLFGGLGHFNIDVL